MLRFRIPLALWGISMVFVVAIVLPLYSLAGAAGVLPSFLTIGPMLLILGVSMVLALYSSELRVGREGVVLYRHNELYWEDVTQARVRTFFGLRYLSVHLGRGLPRWIPLYFEGPMQLEEALIRHAPNGNPVRLALALDRPARLTPVAGDVGPS